MQSCTVEPINTIYFHILTLEKVKKRPHPKNQNDLKTEMELHHIIQQKLLSNLNLTLLFKSDLSPVLTEIKVNVLIIHHHRCHL